MSKLFNSPITQETSPQASGLPLPTWRVKLSNGAVYGPIEPGELRTWAEECRLAPGDQVSSDTGNWVNVETLPELTMQWMVEMVSGEIFGPVHLHAVVDFFHSRLVLPSSRLINRVTGEKSTVADLVLPLIPDAARDDFLAGAPVVADNAASADRLIKFNPNTSSTRLPPDQHKEKLRLHIEQLQATVDESESHIKQLQREIEMRQTKIERLNATLAEKEQHGANAARDWNSIRSEKESRIQTLTRQIEVLTADQTAMRSTLEQDRAEFEQARQETRKLATRAKELNERISVFDSQVQNVSENLTAGEDNVTGQRERTEAMTGEHLQKETQLQTKIEDLTGRLNALNPELETLRGELTGSEAEQQKIRCQGLQEQLGQTEGEFKRREMLWVTEEARLKRGHPGSLERKSMIPPVPDRQKMNHKSEKKVLVVDDSEVIQQLITKLVEKYGASVTAVASARDVTRILAEKGCRFDLFVLELSLPEITGWEILEALRARPETKDTPIVILTGPLSSNEKEKILRKANAVIEKSKFTITDFNKVLNQWL